MGKDWLMSQCQYSTYVVCRLIFGSFVAYVCPVFWIFSRPGPKVPHIAPGRAHMPKLPPGQPRDLPTAKSLGPLLTTLWSGGIRDSFGLWGPTGTPTGKSGGRPGEEGAGQGAPGWVRRWPGGWEHLWINRGVWGSFVKPPQP